jgi:Zn-dependent oligopeptidase
MTSLRDQERLAGNIDPLIINVCNFAKAPNGEPTLLSFDDARTLFHEFGHALHGLLSSVTYPRISGTSVSTDFVELPSQLYEHWLEQPDVLRRYARHYETGEPMPEELLQRLVAARNFNMGFATVEYVSSALVDLEFHSLPTVDSLDAAAFEKKTLSEIGMPAEIGMRHRSPHFGHIFSGSGYASAYYSYMWSEVLDADAFAAFEEAGDIFDPSTAKRLRDTIYAACPAPMRCCASAASQPHDRALHRGSSPRHRLRAPCGCRRSGPFDPGRRRQCRRSYGDDGGHYRRSLSAYEPYRRRRLLVDPRAVRTRPRHHGSGSRRPECTA